MRQHRTIREKANRYFFIKMAVNALLIILAAGLIAFSLQQMQRRASLTRQLQNSEMALADAVTTMQSNTEDADDLTQIFHDGNQDMLDDLQELLETSLFASLAEKDIASRAALFADLVERSGVDYLFLLREDGQVFLAPSADLYGANLVERGILNEDDQAALIQGTKLEDGSVAPVLVSIENRNYYVYSEKISYGGSEYILVLAADATALDLQSSALKDVSSVLGRAAVGNGGFLFAVDTKDGRYLYFDNGTENLTSQTASDTGLSPNALQDGYTGTQTIHGIRYYCVSRAAGENTVIIAAAQVGRIVEKDSYVLFWSVIGFVLVMIISLVYAIIVRNDFVRHAVETKKEIFPGRKGNLVIFDRSILIKVFPLMLTGILLIFCITFYTQTLLEISNGIEKSKVALKDVSGRYQESLENRKVIEKDYSSRFLAKARLIAFLIEEDPSVLNEATTRQYMVYDELGQRMPLPDDEGNPLTSVSSSEKLQQLCMVNDLQSIYIFNADGRTIATSTPNWYFALSHQEEDQSYAFLSVLEGKADSFVQSPQISDLGVYSQFIGVTFTYYSSTDEEGNTVYLSRSDYESRNESGNEQRRIMPHHSLLQIEIEGVYSDHLLASTDYSSIFSSDMLSGGFIMLFESGDGHACLYSPQEANIGKTAEELGISPKAFTAGDYYGFTSMGGTRYFLYARYEQGNYIATAIPAGSMFHSRLRISVIISLMSLVLILILTVTTTFTTKEEELLYATMSEDQRKKGFNSAFFNVMLPSGRRASTARASARWDNRRVPWDEKTPEQKLATLISILFGILLIYLILAAVGARTIFQEESVIYYILSGGWDRGLNIFALSSCVLVLLFTAITVSLLRLPVSLVASLLGARTETVGHLLLSFIRYVGAIAAVFYCLYLIGVDAQGLLASASILSLIVGLGAQSLIKDILAGIFIVFEGEFRVGDIVTIGGYRGTVMDIGLRTTKIMGFEGNVKIFNNSEISGVLNMTKEASLAFCSVSIDYGQDLDYVEAVLKRDLPDLKEKNPAILEEPLYLGVSELGESGVTLLIMARCFEKDVKGVSRYLNREVLQIFYKNGINVPFPQVTLSRIDTKNRKTMADFQKPSLESLYRSGRLVKSEEISVSGSGEGKPEALQSVEELGRMCELTRKQMLHLRLLTEELLGMLSAFTGDVHAVYWTVTQKKDYELHLLADLTMTREMREQLLSIATSGKNEAAQGFMGKLGDMIFAKMLPSASELDDRSAAFRDGGGWNNQTISTEGDVSEWSMSQYVNSVEIMRGGDNLAADAWDEMEKSIVAKLADDVKVSVKGYSAEIIIFKSFPD